MTVLVGLVVASALVLSACGFAPSSTPIDATDMTSDAGVCVEAGTTCTGDALRTCSAPGAAPVDVACSWGCAMNESARCSQLVPSGALLPGDLVAPGLALADVDIATDSKINTMTGAIDGIRGPGSGVVDGIELTMRGGVAVFRFNKLAIAGNLTVTGNNALAIVSITTLDITTGTINIQGTCIGREPGPGGSRGGDHEQPGEGSGKGAKGITDDDVRTGGGGGGYGGTGGEGSTGGAAGGPMFGDPEITMLVGGSGGGGGKNGSGGNQGGFGGGGGGAIQLAANGAISIGAGSINAGGCGGEGGEEAAGGGGGGAGGAILIEGVTITLTGSRIAANGGGGGGGGEANSLGNTDSGTDGQNATAAATAATGGPGGGNGGNMGGRGGDGGSAGLTDGLVGSTGADSGGGGGGAVGRIRFNTRSGAITQIMEVLISPTEASGRATVGAAKTQ
ncbi:MAG: hypothetical protein AB7O24_07665 [Kofleriaceae bacterium]